MLKPVKAKKKTQKNKVAYANAYRKINFRKHPEKYRIGIGEQGVLIAEPYKSEILPHWKFKEPTIARKSATKIYKMFLNYLKKEDFVGADMARKYLQMGWTRARRYANHSSGRKYDKNSKVKPQASDSMTSVKAKSAAIFFGYYQKAKGNKKYLILKQRHLLLRRLDEQISP